MTIPSSDTDINETPAAELGASDTAIREAQERRAERVRMNNAATRALGEQARLVKQPRMRAKARAEHAARVAIETLGVHDRLPESDEFNGVRTGRESIHAAVVTSFEAMARAFDNEYLDGPQGISQVANIGREALAKHAETINTLRNGLARTRQEVEQRLQSAMTPPPHMARMVEQARDALRAMPEKDREALIARARGEESIILAYAVGGAPAFLTGVQDGLQTQKRMILLGLRDPKLLSLEPGIPEAFAALDKIEAGIASLIGSVVDFGSAQALSDLRKS